MVCFMAQRVLIFARPPLLRMISLVTLNYARAKTLRNHVHESHARHAIVAQQCVHPVKLLPGQKGRTAGTLRVFWSWF